MDDEGPKKKKSDIKPIAGRFIVKLIGGRHVPPVPTSSQCFLIIPFLLLLPVRRGLQRHERGSKASKTKINPYFKLELGGTNAIKKRSTPIKNSNSTPDFKSEVCWPWFHSVLCALSRPDRPVPPQELHFDMTAPKTLLQNGDLLFRFEVCVRPCAAYNIGAASLMVTVCVCLFALCL